MNTTSGGDLYMQANMYIMEKLMNIFGFNHKTTPEQYESFRRSFSEDAITKELKNLYSNPKKWLVLTANKENCCMIYQKENAKQSRAKAVLILKTCKEDWLSEDMSQNFLFIELSKYILEQMHIICKDIFFPMLTQSVYQGDSSELISKDLLEKFHNFLSHFYICIGHTKGETRLPLPSDEIFRNPKINDNEKTQICEGAVVMWIELIRYILKQEPEHEFRDNRNPLPNTEIDFWKGKSISLKSILEQIQKEKTLEILKFLEKQKSSYYKLFNDIKKEVVQKSKEATYNYRFLQILEKDFSALIDDNKDLVEIVDYFIPIFHAIRLIWKDNEYYSKPERLIVLIRKICNAVIEKGILYIKPNIFAKILEDPVNEIFRLEKTREVITKFMTAYFTYKDNDVKGWKITRNVIFYRLDAFNDRVGDILNVARSFNEFQKMSNKIIGGIKGETLIKALVDIYDECTAAVKILCREDCLPLTLSSDVFNVRYAQYKETLKELERKIAAVLTQTFDENDTIMGKFKVLDNFDTILERPYIVVELEKKYNILLESFKQELRTVQMLFITGKEYIEKNDPKSPLSKSMPPIAAMLYWTDSLKCRITEPFEKFKICGKKITDKEEFREIDNLYHSIMRMINEYEGLSKRDWDGISKLASGEKQKQCILLKKNDLLSINFDPHLLQLLKEVKYLKILNLAIPQEADAAFSKNAVFRKQIANLENITSQYNTIMGLLNDVEKPMVQEKLKRVETILEPALASITWENTKEIEDFVSKASNNINDLSSTVDKLKSFVTKIEAVFQDWTRKDRMLFKKPEEIMDANALSAKFSAYFEQERTVMNTRVKDFANLSEVVSALKTAISNISSFKETDKWKNYQHYINWIILNGLIDTIYTNLDHLYQCLDPSFPAFCYVTLKLENRKLGFVPELNDTTGRGKSIKGIILEWINAFLNLATIFRVRVDLGMGDYMIEVLENFRIQEIVYKLYNEVNELMKDSEMALNSFAEFKILWEKDFDESFEEFLKTNTVIPEDTPEQQERKEKISKIFNEKTNPIIKDIKEYTPSKEIFDDKINEFKNKLKKVKNMEKNAKTRWIEIDYRLFQNELIKIIESWIENYKSFLHQNSRSKLANINEFMKRVNNGITNKPKDINTKENKDKFYGLLTNLRDMDLMYPKMIDIIPSIKGELEILKKHSKSENADDQLELEEKENENEDQKLLIQTEQLEKDIVELKKKVDASNEEISDLIDQEKEDFRKKKKAFETNVENFRSEFLRKAPKELVKFQDDEIKNAFKTMDQYYEDTKKLEEEKKQNNDMELLLKIPLSSNKQISDCLIDLGLYKTVWDYILLIFNTFENWKKIKMDKVDVNDLLEQIDLFKSMLKTQVKKEIKNNIPAFGALMKKVNEMDDTIQVISLLKEKAIKPRHWKHLMEITKKIIPYDQPDFSIDTLIKLELFADKAKVEEEKNIAASQEKIEIAYNKIDKTWQTEKFRMTKNLNKKNYEFFLFDHTQMGLVIEALEKDQTILIQMSQRKSVLDNCEGMDVKLNDKLAQLKVVNDVIKQWLKFQGNWEKLEVIFLKSDDIQNKLRNEYQEFKKLNDQFREEMKYAYDYNLMINVCTLERKRILDEMSENIAICQKALDNYLAQKKTLFPRFYFVSNDTLLNMLSYADLPNIINKNVKDCFDGIKCWAMKELDKNDRSDTVLAMLSADNDEEVWFDVPFVCQGQLVEVYLSEFEKKMRNTLKDILLKAYTAVQWNITSNTDKSQNPRHLWLNPYPAQLALLVTQMVWTEEVEHALEATDGGENGALKDYLSVCENRINHLIDRVRDEVLTRDLRMKIITIITVDVHARDVVELFSKKSMMDSSNFNWKKQLRFKYLPEKLECDIQICDFRTKYSYEYIGNTGRLVITPLTDRCYITLTQALNLILGGAPAGPAGTGKTETVKDLGRNLGLGVIVNNCSEQMTIETTERIFSGLSQTGFWGCFDEFNRISIEVLSVVSSQVKTVLDAMRVHLPTFVFESNEIKLVDTCGFFITMNPGYAGRTELPDNLKALFRSCAMVVPDLKEICQNMLMSEGFNRAGAIAAKFITLYTLSKDLLSKQKHYDWGLRAIKSLLRQAGGLKRHPLNKPKPEMFIIMKALFDFNKAKIVPDDLIIFERLLQDLFKETANQSIKDDDINQVLDSQIEEATEVIGLQKDAGFTLKARQLKEILKVRHCLFIIGPPGCGKSSVWKTLFYTYKEIKKKDCAFEKLSPKAISGKELFGYVDEKTKAWKYGILSSIMKKMCKSDAPYRETMRKKWIILDGDIDPKWIESLNTVMDDNKVLTLTNGDRFPLDEFMRLIFEVSNLRNATLATVSRGGVLYINEKDIGIIPVFDKWVKTFYSKPEHQVTKRVLQEFFKDTFGRVKEMKEKFVAPIVDISLLKNFCAIFQNLISEQGQAYLDQEEDKKALIVEAIFFFSFMWGCGGGLYDRKEMSSYINASIKSKNKLRFPDAGTCFDYFFNVKDYTWTNWNTQLKSPDFRERDLFNDIIIPNVEVSRLCKIVEINLQEDKPCLFVGDAGTGKTAIVNYFMKTFLGDLQKKSKTGSSYKAYSVNFNSFTDSFALQNIIDSQISQRYSNKFGPLGNTKLIYFLDDLNMPLVDDYGTQSHVELLRQVVEDREYFDRKDLEVKKILEDLLFIGSQNPKAGSFVIDLRLQRHFTLLAATEPNQGIINEIYTAILKNHFKDFKWKSNETVEKFAPEILAATNTILVKVRGDKVFAPSATKFHYQWNMREISKVINGLLRTTKDTYKDTLTLYKLWYHEVNRVFKDRLILPEDIKRFEEANFTVFDSSFKWDNPNKKDDMAEPFIFVPFDETVDDTANVLVPPKDFAKLKETITYFMNEYIENKGDMFLVLFDDAIMHICRIARIISNPCSHALLVGVGGSGKTSLCTLAAYIKGIDIYSPNLTGASYNCESFLADFRNVVTKSVMKPSMASPSIFLINDGHIIEEYFLVYINNFLSSYWIDEMYESKQDLENLIVQKLKVPAAADNFTKSIADYTNEELFTYLIYRVKSNIHLTLCMSPVGDTLRVRARKFPSILNGTTMDWFHEWPDTALEKVSARSIGQMPQFCNDENMVTRLSKITAELHNSIKVFNDSFFKYERRYNYTTPKSFLELIKFYQLLIQRKDDDLENQILRLEKGLAVVTNASASIAGLKVQIEEKSIEVEIQKKENYAILQDLEKENAYIAGEKAIVTAAAEEAQKKSAQADIDEKDANDALKEANPLKENARKEAENISAQELTEFKKPNNPSDNNYQVFKVIYLVFKPEANMPSNDIKKELPGIKNAVLNVPAETIKIRMIERLNPISWVTDQFLEKMKDFLVPPWTDIDQIKKISLAAGGVMGYFKNLVAYKKMVDYVDPILKRAELARKEADDAKRTKEEMEARLEEVSKKQKEVQALFNESKAKKDKVEAEQKLLQDKLAMAEKFIGLLAGNNIRWKEEVGKMKQWRKNLAGDCLLSSCFVSYIGVFNSSFRLKLIEKWKSIISAKDVMLTQNIDIVRALVNEADILKYKAEGLPSDPFSIENSVIITQCTRWPLIIDPQTQAILWLKTRGGKKTIVQYKQQKWDLAIGEAIQNGEILIIEDVDQEIDPLLAPIMAKQTITKDKSSKCSYIKVGSEDYPFHPNTQIYFLTKIANPHYKPEVAAQCTLINFIVTEKGLEDQLLAMVVNIEQPELEDSIRRYINEINEFQAELIVKEDDVLRRLEEAEESTILENIELVSSLENTKARAVQIEEKSRQTTDLIKEINEKRELYRGVGEEGAMLYFLISKLFVVQYTYQYSLKSFIYFFDKAIANTEKNESIPIRVASLREKIRITVYIWISAGMFEKDKQLLLTMISLRLLQKKGALTDESCLGIGKEHIDFLLQCPRKLDAPPREKSMEFLSPIQWETLWALSSLDGLQEFAQKVEKEYSSKFKEWYNEISPEDVDLPPEWKKYKKHSFHKILVLRACRPERVGIALNEFIRKCLPRGNEFLEPRTFSDSLLQAYFDSKSDVPIFFILSAGSNPIKELEVLGKEILPKRIKKKFELTKSFFQVAMGQNAEKKAEELLKDCNSMGYWLFLQNIHLMPKWLKTLQDKVKEISNEKGNDDFRLFLSAEPRDTIPVGILEKCIKISNEPPSGLKENMKIAFTTLLVEKPGIESRGRKAVIFGLCYFHAVVIERKKFGSLGWNRNYPFNLDDLRSSDEVVAKYLEGSTSKIPWEDLKYIVGEIMYGGHIVDDMDRALNNSYLDYLLKDQLTEDLDLVPYCMPNSAVKVSPIKTPINNPNYTFDKWGEYIENVITQESPALFGLHPNAELEYRIAQAENLFRNLTDLEPKDSGGSGEESDGNKFERVKNDAEEIAAKSADGIFNVVKMKADADKELNPDQNVFMQECEQMKNLCELIKRNTSDIREAIEGRLTMTERIEKLINAIWVKRVPEKWIEDGFETNRNLTSWLVSLVARIDQLKLFENNEFTAPKVVFINRLFNPLSYLTAIRQMSARVLEQELDKLDISTEPSVIDLQKQYEVLPLKENAGVPIYGMHLQGCRWDEENRQLDESKPKENFYVMPIIYCKVVPSDQVDPKTIKGAYVCPIYKTIKRDTTFVGFAQFKTPKVPAAKWTIAGVAAILDCEKTDHINNNKLK